MGVLKGYRWLLISDGIMLVIVLVVAGIFYFQFQSIVTLRNEMASSTQMLNQRFVNLEAILATTTLTGEELSRRLAEEQAKSTAFEESIDDIAGTVGDLEKLSKTDKELLQKYSRVYFLSDNYVPMELESIDSEYLYDQAKDLQFHASALYYLKRMLNRAEGADVIIKVVSAYRSFGEQSTLKNTYLTTYGSGSNQFSADQGYSEHQLGTAVDLAEASSTSILTTSFETTASFEWLTKNAYKYGFVISYPKNNVYYQYEPWHWRFVGVRLATRLHNDGINFSDMEQREIDTYLVRIFD